MGGKLRRLMTCCMPIVPGRHRQSGAKKKKHRAQSAAQKPNMPPSYYESIDLSPDGHFSTNNILTKAQQSDEISVGSNTSRHVAPETTTFGNQRSNDATRAVTQHHYNSHVSHCEVFVQGKSTISITPAPGHTPPSGATTRVSSATCRNGDKLTGEFFIRRY